MKLIFLDIDGTFTVGGVDTPPASAAEAVRRTREKGNLVFLCTGRNSFLIEPFLKYGFDGVIGSSGGYIRCGDELIYDHPLKEETMWKAVDVLHRNGVYVMLEAQEANYGDVHVGDLLKDTDGGNSELQRWRKRMFDTGFMYPIDQWPGTPVYKMVAMYERPEQIEEAEKELHDDFELVIQSVEKKKGVQNMELVNRDFDKGRAVELVMKKLGVAREDTYGFGDSMNDLPMIRSVGCGVCMGNGAQALKQISDVVIGRADEDGLYLGFKQLGLL